jgi:serine protease Do
VRRKRPFFELETKLTRILRAFAVALLLGAAVIAVSEATSVAAVSALRRSPVVEAVERAGPAVVNVNTEQEVSRRPDAFWGFPGGDFFEDFFRDFLSPFPRSRTRTSLGSGVLIDAKGYILTNEHVIRGADKIRVTLADKREFLASLVGADPPSDLAVLRIDTREGLPVIPLGQSDDLLIGETVIAIGNPFGLSHTVTTGVISALNRSIRTKDRIYRDFIQTDAAINPGNSGGPLLNIEGKLVGINTAIYQKAQGVGFAIPINRALRIKEDLIHYGHVQPAWIGLEVQDLTEQLVQYFGLATHEGVLVAAVNPGGPADEAGVRKGDLITAIGDVPVASRQEFFQTLAGYTADSTVELTSWRKREPIAVKVKAQVLSPDRALHLAEASLGIAVGAVTTKTRKEYQLTAEQGVVVVRVEANGLAYRAGLRPGDVIRRINDQEIVNPEDYGKAMPRALRRGSLLLLIQRGTHGFYLTLDLGGA